MIKLFCKIEQKGNICMNVFCDENDLIILYQMKNLKILCIYCSLKIKIIHIMSISKILTDLCVITQIKIKSAFPDTFYIALMVKKSWKSIKKLFNNK